MNNIGKSMNGNSTGLKWLVSCYPGGSADSGGIQLKMWVDTDQWEPMANLKTVGN